jgi:hypothetical protein
VSRDLGEHVVQKADAGSDVVPADAVQVYFQPNVGLAGLAFHHSPAR